MKQLCSHVWTSTADYRMKAIWGKCTYLKEAVIGRPIARANLMRKCVYRQYSAVFLKIWCCATNVVTNQQLLNGFIHMIQIFKVNNKFLKKIGTTIN